MSNNNNKLITLATMQEFNKNKTKNIFVDESGTTIVQGNFKVQGMSTTLDTQTLTVKDNIVVTNSDGESLAGEAGFAIKTGGASGESYGITYNPNPDINGVRIGLGNISEGTFTYQEGEAQFLATRADSIDNGNLVQWDNSKNTLIDAGKSISSFVDRQSGVTTYDQAYIKLGNGAQGMLNISDSVLGESLVQRLSNGHIKVASNPDAGDYAVNKDYVSGVLNDYVKFTDEAGKDVFGVARWARREYNPTTSDYDSLAGIVSYNPILGINAYSHGYYQATLYINGASDAQIEEQENLYQPICPIRLSHAVKVGVTANKEELTDDTLDENGNTVKGEKTKACEWLGAVPKGTNTNAGNLSLAYVIKPNQEVDFLTVTEWGASPNSLAKRDGNGCVAVATPRGNNDATNKKYVEDNFVAKLGEGDGWRVYGVYVDGTETSFPVVNAVTEATIPWRGVGGTVIVGTPTADNHATNKGYVDGLKAELLARIEALETKLSTMTEEVTSTDISSIFEEDENVAVEV